MQREDNPRWRLILEERWRDRLRQVTELSLAYHGAAAQAPAGLRDEGARRLLGQAIVARRRLADTEDALARLAAGGFGRCEQCLARIADALLAAAPETRYCGDCVAAAGVTTSGTMTGPLADRVPAPRVPAGQL